MVYYSFVGLWIWVIFFNIHENINDKRFCMKKMPNCQSLMSAYFPIGWDFNYKNYRRYSSRRISKFLKNFFNTFTRKYLFLELCIDPISLDDS